MTIFHLVVSPWKEFVWIVSLKQEKVPVPWNLKKHFLRGPYSLTYLGYCPEHGDERALSVSGEGNVLIFEFHWAGVHFRLSCSQSGKASCTIEIEYGMFRYPKIASQAPAGIKAK